MRKLKKAFSLTLALMMCLSLTIPSLAAVPPLPSHALFQLKMEVGDKRVTSPHGFYITLSAPVCGIETVEGTRIHLVPIGTKITEIAEYTGTIPETNLIHQGDGHRAIENPFVVSDEQIFLLETSIYFRGVAVTAEPTNDKLTVNGELANPTVYKINGSNYFKIRDIAALLDGTEKQFAVGYDGEKKSVTATPGQGYAKQAGDLLGAPTGGNKQAEISSDAIYINGGKAEVEVYKIDGSNYFKLRDLGKALNFYVGYESGQGVLIDTSKSYE